MERANGARNGKAQSEPRAKRVHEPMAPGAVRRTAWVADAGAPVPSVSLGGVPGLWSGAGRAEALPLRERPACSVFTGRGWFLMR